MSLSRDRTIDTMRWGVRSVLLLCAALIWGACGDDADGSPATPGESAANATPAGCELDAGLSVLTTAGELQWADTAPSVELTRSNTEGCLQGMTLEVGADDECQLALSIRVDGSALRLESGALTVTAACSGELTLAEGVYAADPEHSTAGLTQDMSAAEADENGCVALKSLALVGRVSLRTADSEGEDLALYLDSMPLNGSVEAALADKGACAETVATCTDMTCGEDSFGIACGECSGDQVCTDNTCGEALCPPKGPYGVDPGSIATDVTLMDCDGNLKSIHDMCGANAAHINLLAGW